MTAHVSESIIVPILLWGINDLYVGVNILMIFSLVVGGVLLLCRDRRDWRGWLLVVACCLSLIRTAVGAEYDQRHPEYRHTLSHDGGMLKLGHYQGLTVANLNA